MKTFENSFQWSHTRARTFTQCKRLYYYSYYGYWGGWAQQAPPDVRLLYVLKKMVTIPMWTGSIVHRCIEHAITSARLGSVVGLEELRTMALKQLSAGWIDSRNGAWKNDPKGAVNLAEHYYRRFVDPGVLQACLRGTLASLEAFHRSDVFHYICADPSSVLAVEELMTFTVETVPVVMVADLALKVGDECHIYDWKSGGVAPLVGDQLAVYALGAMMRWKYPQEKVRLFVSYLAEGVVEEVLCSVREILNIRDAIADLAGEMRSWCEDPAKNRARPKQAFPLSDSIAVCSSCMFRQVCLPELVAEEDKSFFLALQQLKESGTASAPAG